MNRYSYVGPVMEFDRYVADSWRGETTASSEAKARSNLAYRYKKENGKAPGAKITLPGKITLVK